MEEKETKKKVAKVGTNIYVLTTIIFTALQACHVINWQWWQILMPMFVYTGIVFLLAVCAMISLVIEWFASR